tara:strand:- start:79 stop:642 length:564 start_codon:yes stop_codon:yes gene_type:complete
MEITNPKRHKYYMIYDWKRKGVIADDYDEVYDIYINTMECNHCGKEFCNTKERHLDHCHQTGDIRAIVCQKCNNYDNYIRFPEGGYTEEHDKERRKIYRKDNRDKIRIKRHKYEQENAETISIRKKKQYQKNKERLKEIYQGVKDIKNEKRREKYTCICGITLTKAGKSRHERDNIKHSYWLMEQVD